MIGFFEANRRGGDKQKKELIEFGSGLAELEDVYSTYTQRHWIMTGQSFLTLKDFFSYSCVSAFRFMQSYIIDLSLGLCSSTTVALYIRCR